MPHASVPLTCGSGGRGSNSRPGQIGEREQVLAIQRRAADPDDDLAGPGSGMGISPSRTLLSRSP